MKKRIALAEAMRRALAIIVTYALMWSLVPALAVAQMQDEAGANEEQAEQVPLDQNSPQEMQSAEEGVSADEDEQRLAELAHKLATRVRSEVSKETEENAEGLPREDALAARYVRILHVMLARVLSLETEGQAATADEQAVTADAQDQELRAAVKDSGTSARLVAKALAELGVEAVVVGRQSDGARWVMVRIDGEWYHADAWADAQRVIAKRHEQQPMQQAEDEPSVPADAPSYDTMLCIGDARLRELDPARESWTLEDGSDAPQAAADFDWAYETNGGLAENTSGTDPLPDDSQDAAGQPGDGDPGELDPGEDAQPATSEEQPQDPQPQDPQPQDPQPQPEGDKAAPASDDDLDATAGAPTVVPQQEGDPSGEPQGDVEHPYTEPTGQKPAPTNEATLESLRGQTVASKLGLMAAQEETTPLAMTPPALLAAATNVTNYTYEVTPLLSPFNDVIYVKTNNPDPTSFVLADKSSRYDSTASTPAQYNLLNTIFLDVRYENLSTYRVNGGYLFYDRYGNADGGTLTVQAKGADGTYADTNIRVICPALKTALDYLVEDCASQASDFFTKVELVSMELTNHSIYPNTILDSSKPNEDSPYPFLASSPRYELSLNQHCEQMFEPSSQTTLLKYMYPLIRDSSGWPYTLYSAAHLINGDCTYRSGYTHAQIYICLNGEERLYEGAGNGGRTPMLTKDIGVDYLFDGSANDAAFESLGSAYERLMGYKQLADASFEPYLDQIRGTQLAQAVEPGSWIRVRQEGSSNSAYAYVMSGIKAGETYTASHVWVDGRYVSNKEIFTPGPRFENAPTADIIIRNMTYTDRYNNQHTRDVLFRYDSSSQTWRADSYYDNMSVSIWSTGNNLPDELVLTKDEVMQLGVDQNSKEPIERALLYDGYSAPGTPLDTVHVESIALDAPSYIQVGGQETVKVTVLPEDAGFKYFYLTSSDPNVLKVSSKTITGVSPGTATLTATSLDGNFTSSCKVVVHERIQSATLPFTTVKMGETTRFALTVVPSTAPNAATDWQSSDTSIATVDDRGNVRGVEVGYTNITCRAVNGSLVYGGITVVGDVSKATIAPIKGRGYNGMPYEPKPKVTLGRRTLVEGEDFDFSYKNNVYASNGRPATLTITGKGNYTGTKSASFDVWKNGQPMDAWAVARQAPAASLRTRDVTVEAPIHVAHAVSAGRPMEYRKKGGDSRLNVDLYTGRVTVRKGTPAGTYKVTIKAIAFGGSNYADGSRTVECAVRVVAGAKLDQDFKVTANDVVRTSLSLASSDYLTRPFKAAMAAGNVSYMYAGGSSCLSVDYSGRLRIARGTPKGTYYAYALATAAGDAGYLPCTQMATVTVVVK